MPQKKHKPEEIVAKLRQVDVFISQVARPVGGRSWCQHYKTKRSHSSLGDRPPAPEVV